MRRWEFKILLTPPASVQTAEATVSLRLGYAPALNARRMSITIRARINYVLMTVPSLQIRRFWVKTTNNILLDSGGEVEKVYKCAVDSHDIYSARGIFLRLRKNLSENFGRCDVNIEVER